MMYWLIKNLYKIFALTYLDYKVVNRENLLDLRDGGYVVASNHVSFLDPPLVGIAFRENLHFFARKTLFDNPIFGWVLRQIQAIPVNQDQPEISTLKNIIQLLKDGQKVVIFPEGERTLDGKIKEVGQAGVGMMVEKSGAKVLPVRLFGPEIAMPRNSKRIRSVPVTLVVGEVMDFSAVIEDKALDRREKYERITARIMEAIRRLECPADRLPKG